MKELNYAKVGARIRQARKEKGWSRDVLAKKSGISLYYIGHIERGTRRMSMDTFVNLCRALETNADELLWGNIQKKLTEEQKIQCQMEQADDESYSMYMQMIRSVADIMINQS